ncbi:conserved exported hypothetical protein [Candidatus Desulfarcum epimagneticum]|uniref:Membrane protein insertion efficiency factor YidD n=1 Tax=uncultured Desulfobacteraceae bacterium TaxID=218296 RepID=A0A484HEG3_9BACT|nr:conserved exported hypothetical protein [uncultured Desulfobacteraceae bacterium]
MKKRVSLFFPALAAALCLVSCAHFEAPRERAGKETNVHSLVIDGFYRGVLNSLEGVRGGVCPMRPSCSRYAKEAIEKFGFLKGWAMAMDRLLRCGRDETRLAPRVRTDRGWKCLDRVRDNVFREHPSIHEIGQPQDEIRERQ